MEVVPLSIIVHPDISKDEAIRAFAVEKAVAAGEPAHRVVEVATKIEAYIKGATKITASSS